MKNNSLKIPSICPDLIQQLDIIFHCAPGPHEIRIIGRYYRVKFEGKNIEKVWKNDRGSIQTFSIGAPRSVKEAEQLILSHFHDDNTPHNCYMVINRTSDDFCLHTKRREIGDLWYPGITTFLTKANDVVARCSLPIDIDRVVTQENENGVKLAASEEELTQLNEVRIDLVKHLNNFNISPNYQIMTGNGYQVVSFFDAQMESKEIRQQIEIILKGLNEKYHGKADIDTSLVDPSRVLRLCALNRKPGRIEDRDQGRVYRVPRIVDETCGMLNNYKNIKHLTQDLQPLAEKYVQRNKEQKQKCKPVRKVNLPVQQQGKKITIQDFLPQNNGNWVDERLRAGGISLVLQALEKVKGGKIEANEQGDKIIIKCPYHKDHSPSAWISMNGNGIAFVHCSAKGCYLKNNSQTAIGIISGDELDFKDACLKLFGEIPPSYCKFCNKEILWNENKKPLNRDGSFHNCRTPAAFQTIAPQTKLKDETEEIILPRTKSCETMPFPINVLPSTLKQYAKEIAKAVSCPIDLVVLPQIVICGAAIGNTHKLLIKKGHVESAILYGATVALPGSGKSPAVKAVIEYLEIIDSMLSQKTESQHKIYEEEIELYQVKLAKWRDKIKQGEKCSKPEKPEDPKELAIITNDATTESLAKLMKDNPRGFLLHRDELSGWVRSFGKYRQASGDDKEFFLQNWNNMRTKVTRSTKRTIVNEKSHISVLGTIQPENLSVLRSSIQDGFIDRILFAFPDSQISKYSEYEVNQSVKKSYCQTIEKLFHLQFKEVDKKTGINIPYFIPLTPEAKTSWIEYRNKTELEKHEGHLCTTLSNIWSKIPSQVARIALIFALCDDAREVSELIMKNAIKVGEYFKNHYSRVFWETETTKEEKEHNALLSWAKRKNKTVVAIRDIVNYGVAGCRNTKQARTKITSLIAVGAAKWISKGKFEILKVKKSY